MSKSKERGREGNVPGHRGCMWEGPDWEQGWHTGARLAPSRSKGKRTVVPDALERWAGTGSRKVL